MHKIRFLAVFAALVPYCAPAIAQVILPPPPEKPQVDGNGVDVQSLTPSYERSVLSIGPKGPGGLDFSILYTGAAPRDNLYTMIAGNDNGGSATATVQIGSFAENFLAPSFPSMGDGSSFSGAAAEGYNFRQKDGTDTAFTQLFIVAPDGDFGTNGWWMADSITRPNGVQTSFHYRSVNIGPGQQAVRIQSVTTNMGYQFKYNYASNTYDGTPGSGYFTLTSIVAINNAVEYCDPNADTCSLTGAWPQLHYLTGTSDGGVTDANGGTTYIVPSYCHTPQHVTIQTPDHTSPNYDYTLTPSPFPSPPGPCVVTSATVNGKTTNYALNFPAGGTQVVTSTGPLSQQYSYTAISNVPGITKKVDPLGRTTTYTYDAFNRLLSVTPPEGNTTNYTYDSNGNVLQITLHPKTGSGSTPLSESWTYGSSPCYVSPKTCNQPDTHTDPRGNVTTYSYDANHGGVLTETDPADANGIHPVKRYAYAQRYAWIKNASGSYVQAPTPIWLRTEERTCAQTATVGGACAGGSSDEIVTSYDYGPNSGPNNLLLRGKVVAASGTSLRTCYGYDQYGNKISETSPRAGLTSCP